MAISSKSIFDWNRVVIFFNIIHKAIRLIAPITFWWVRYSTFYRWLYLLICFIIHRVIWGYGIWLCYQTSIHGLIINTNNTSLFKAISSVWDKKVCACNIYSICYTLIEIYDWVFVSKVQVNDTSNLNFSIFVRWIHKNKILLTWIFDLREILILECVMYCK